MHDRAFVAHVDEAAANTDLARGAAHNYGAVVALLKSLTKAQLLARTQQVVDIGRGHGAHARFAAAAGVERNLGAAEVAQRLDNLFLSLDLVHIGPFAVTRAVVQNL